MAESAADKYNKLRVVDLQEECKKLGLNTKGKKQELIDRLVEAAATTTTTGEATGGGDEQTAGAKRGREEEQEQEQEAEKKSEPVQQEEQQQSEAKKDVASSALDASHDTVVVSGFQRPFTEDGAREFLCSSLSAPPLSWAMNAPMRSLAVVRVASPEEAASLAKRVNGVVWPKLGKALQAETTTFDAASKRLSGNVSAPEPAEKKRKADADDKKKKDAAATAPAAPARDALSEKAARAINEKFMKTKTEPSLYYSFKEPGSDSKNGSDSKQHEENDNKEKDNNNDNNNNNDNGNEENANDNGDKQEETKQGNEEVAMEVDDE